MSHARLLKLAAVSVLSCVGVFVGGAHAGQLFPPIGEIRTTHTCPDGQKMLMWKDGEVRCQSVLDNLCTAPLVPSIIDSKVVCCAGNMGTVNTTYSCSGSQRGSITVSVTTNCDGTTSTSRSNSCYTPAPPKPATPTGSFTTTTTQTCTVGSKKVGTMVDGVFIPGTGETYTCTTSGLK